MSIVASQISYIHPDKEPLFQNLNFTLSDRQKVALIGNNGSGKSTLLRILNKSLPLSSGEILYSDLLYYVPQHFGQYNRLTIAQVLGIELKINALHAILEGDTSVDNFTILDDNWNIEEKALTALSTWNLKHLELSQPMKLLSGGEKTKVFLSGIELHSPSFVLLDEPSNHLDRESREQLYNFIRTTKSALLIVSHDRTLLNLLDQMYELTPNEIIVYGGNYDFYKQQKEEQLNAIENQLIEKEKTLRKARQTARKAIERKQKEDSRGKRQNEKKGVAKIMMNKLKNKAENSSSKLKDIHTEKIGGIIQDLREIRQKIPEINNLKLDFRDAQLHKGKVLITAEKINCKYITQFVWENSLTFQIRSGDRIAIQGANGSGKTTLLKLIIGEIESNLGTLIRYDFNYLYIDQEYSLLDNKLSILELAEQYNFRSLEEHELKIILHRFLFPSDIWNKKCVKLSGGEKMRLLFCCLMIQNQAPDLFILDEPTNNLDIQSMEIVTDSLKEYEGTIVLVSHDEYFIKDIGIDQYIEL